mgnify:FL=1
MSKVLKNVLIGLCGVFAFLFAGVFFVGCNRDYSNIQLTADQQNLVLNKDDSATVVFTLENYVGGFSNRVQINALSDGQTEIFSYSEPIYLSDNEFQVTVTGTAGGTGRLEVKTLQGGKTCYVDINVEQYSSSMEYDNSVLYVSNETDFVPTADIFDFDNNTTHKELSYFYLEPVLDVDGYLTPALDLEELKNYDLVGIETNEQNSYATFSDGVSLPINIDIIQFDRVVLNKTDTGNSLILQYQGIDHNVELQSQILMLAVYDHSLPENGGDAYENILYAVSPVYVLPSLEFSVEGGYIDPETQQIDFQPFEDDSIRVVPNNTYMREYVLKITLNNSFAQDQIVDSSPIEFFKSQSNNYVDIDFFNYEGEEPQENVRYFKISQNSQTQTETRFTIEIMYNIAQDIDDESVHVRKDFQANIEIAPNALLVNGTPEPEKITLYNYYQFPEFGWNELVFDVASGLESSPNFDGIYFEFDASYLDLTYNGINVVSDPDGTGRLYTDLSVPFYIRGAYDCEGIDEITLTVHLKSDILQNQETNEIVLPITFEIVEGARDIFVDANYQNYNRTFNLDFEAGTQDFNNVIYADQLFQYTIYSLDDGDDVVDIDTHDENPYLAGNYLNLSITPKAIGTGYYNIYLDNGMMITLTFNVSRTLKAETTSIQLSSEGNDAVTNFAVLSDGQEEYNNIVSMEILNSSTRDRVTFGSLAYLDVVANTTRENIEFVPREAGIISVVSTGASYRITTLDNGYVAVDLTLTGQTIENFRTLPIELNYIIYISSYSLLEEFYLRNGNNYALNNTIYRGGDDESASVNFSVTANNERSFGFYRYTFLPSALPEFFNNPTQVQDGLEYYVQDNQIGTFMNYTSFDQEYIYFYAQDAAGTAISPSIVATISVTDEDGNQVEAPKTIKLVLNNSLMFYAQNDSYVYEEKDDLGNVINTLIYTIEFENMIYSVDVFGEFDLNNFTYRTTSTFDYQLTLSSNVRQRNLTRRFDATINCRPFQSVESISLTSSVTELNFSNDVLTYTLGVYTYPTNSTNKNLNVDIIRTNDNPYSIVDYTIDYSGRETGTYSITFSCENFFNAHQDDIVDIEDSLTGTIFIYPSEWGDNYSSINSNLRPIEIDFQYRNGSVNNPYLLETVEDIQNINTNEITLRSHYELASVIDMTSVENFTPIGILTDGEEKTVVGFSGSIVGTSSQAAITNVVVTENNFLEEVDGVYYGGLFAKINDNYTYYVNGEERSFTPTINNISVSGSFNLDMPGSGYLSLVAAVNEGELVNVGTRVSSSKIDTADNSVVYVGAISGVNYGLILQDFTFYESGNGTSKILAYFNDALTINMRYSNVFAGGIAGFSSGQIKRITSQNLSLYGYSSYSAYTLIDVTGVGSNNGHQNVAVGGAVGLSSFNTQSTFVGAGGGATDLLLPEIEIGDVYLDANDGSLIENLLVGGEIDTTALVDSIDYVGGIAGYVDAVNTRRITFRDNTSRMFLRAQEYVGGIVGFDVYSTAYNDNGRSYFEPNTIEAVDDGRSAFYAAAIIKTNAFPDGAIDTTSKGNAFFAIGNASRNNAAYGTDIFTVSSYLQRNKDDIVLFDGENAASATVVNANSSSTDNFYGDYIVVERISSGNNNYYIRNTFEFEKKMVELGLEDSDFVMTSDQPNSPTVYFMYYFSVESVLNGTTASQAQIDELNETLNVYTPNNPFYPFALTNQEVNIVSSSTSILSIDINGNITLRRPGLAIINLSSIVNTQTTRQIYVYVVNYFDKNVTTSMFYTSKTSDGVLVNNNSTSTIYGNSTSRLELVPSYSLDKVDGEDYLIDGERVFISENGVLNYRNVNYVLTKNYQMTVDYSPKDDENYFSRVEISNQTVFLYKNPNKNPDETSTDTYQFVPVLKTEIVIDGTTYTYFYELSNAEINLNVRYREQATSIKGNFGSFNLQSNGDFSDTITVVSTNPQELLFYQVFFNGELIQNRLPGAVGDINENTWESYINYGGDYSSNDQFFNLHFERRAGEQNVFDYTCEVNTLSNRFLTNRDIYGEYVVTFYASQLEEGVTYSIRINLTEAKLNSISISNFSHMSDISVEDYVIVPSQRGLLEITLDPVEGIFDEISISNNAANYASGANEATLTFVYEKVGQTEVEYVLAPTFGDYANGTLSFTYAELMEFFDNLNESFADENASVSYVGKIYVSYFMPSVNVEDGQEAGFDVEVRYGNDLPKTQTLPLTIQLGSYAQLEFVDKEAYGGRYYVARGLSYDMVLNYYGFSPETDISIRSTNSNIVNISQVNGNYVLQVTSNPISYNNDNGYRVDIITTATKIVDGNVVRFEDTLELYVMEYVVDYVYQEGRNEDIVRGMSNGVISTAVGNPYRLEFDIRNFLEYDTTNSEIQSEVENFVNEMTQNITWQVYYNNAVTTLTASTSLRNDYFTINGFTVTPLVVYNAESDIYHFSAGAYYTMLNGRYSFSSISNENRIYTEFSFDVHNQSTQDSPNPVRTYEEFLDMREGEWYILLNDIVLPGNEYATAHQMEEFKPISTNIAGLDGNGYALILNGTYNFTDLSDVGVFSSIGADTIIQNVTVKLSGAVNFRLNVETFNVGLLAANNAGIITNCSVESEAYENTLSILNSVTFTDSYVAGLVAMNDGYITNSRSSVRILSNAHLSGFVGVNSNTGLIASSAFVGGTLRSATATEYTAGFVIENNGQIYTSYVSGNPEAGKLYYDGTENYILSSNHVAGFAFTNTNTIEDCYSNTRLIQSGAFTAGFVFENSGNIARCFSTSIFENLQSSNYGFARANYLITDNETTSDGTILDCFYLQDNGINEGVGDIRNVEGQIEIEKLSIQAFGDMDNFSNFVVAQGRDTSSVWFFNNDTTNFANFGGAAFNTGRIELVAPNIVAFSQRELDRIETVVDATTGASYARYIYTYTSDALGTVYNPILISDAETMENYILQENNAANYNYRYYRLISDIDYSEYIYNSKLFTTRFMGYFEGNFMTVSNISLLSSDPMTYAGLFAEVGRSSLLDAVGTVMNFTLRPVAVSFSNTNVVGALAGRVDGGKIFNVDVELMTENSAKLIVVGKNIVGGAVGLTLGNFRMQNVNSQLGAKARTQASTILNNFDSSNSNFENYSFAGGLAGVLSGSGTLSNSNLSRAISVLGAKTGLMFGLIDAGVSVSDIDVVMNADMLINAYTYGGLVAGESKGLVSGVDVVGFNGYFTNFRQVPFEPEAVGGFAGLISGGSIDNISVSQSIQTSNETSRTGIAYLGGIAGVITESVNLSDVDMSGSLVGLQVVGGLAGNISTTNRVTFENVDVQSGLEVRGLNITEIGLGGIVGELVQSGVVSVINTENSENNIQISVNVNMQVYGSGVNIYVGPIIGNNRSNLAHTISNTFMSVTGSASALDLSGESGGTVSEHIYVALDEDENATLNRTADEIIEDSILPGTSEVYYFCDVTFSTQQNAGSATNYTLYLNLYGVPTVRN